MIKSKEIEGPSCLTQAADDEPLFVLRANDELAAIIVHEWVQRYRAQKGAAITQAQEDKAEGAMRIADAMRAWYIAHNHSITP